MPAYISFSGSLVGGAKLGDLGFVLLPAVDASTTCSLYGNRSSVFVKMLFVI